MPKSLDLANERFGRLTAINPEYKNRTDNDQGYNKINCKWVTRRQNCENRSNTIFYEYRGKKVTLTFLSIKYGMSVKLLYARLITQGLSLEEALRKPVRKNQWDVTRSKKIEKE